MASILLNSSSLLRIDLEGVNVLAPSLVAALEAVLPEREVCLLYIQYIYAFESISMGGYTLSNEGSRI